MKLIDLFLEDVQVTDWIETLLTVPSEDRGIIDFKLTDQQHMMQKDMTGRDIIIKGRQTRASSFIMAYNLRDMVTRFGINQVVVTQTDEMTQLFRVRIKHHLTDLMNKGFPFEIGAENDAELELKGFQNRYIWASAEQKAGKRGVQTAHIIHASEVAHWPARSAGNIIGGLIPACPPPPYGRFTLESTPNGAQGLFYESVITARPLNPMSMWTVHFYPWWLERTYTLESLRALFDVEDLLHNFVPTGPETQLMVKYGLTPGQILWRRIKTDELRKTGQFFLQEYPEDITTCFLTAGECYFADPEFDHLAYYRQQVIEPAYKIAGLKYGQNEINFRGGLLHAWELPVPGRAYVTWLDTAGGGSSGDFSAITVLDATTLHHVATLQLKTTPERAGAMACAVAQFYNTAMLVIERNSYGQSALRVALEELKYPNLYIDVINEPNKPSYGWYTTPANRDKMLSSLREAVFSHTFVSHDIVLLMEMGGFTWQQAAAGRWKAEAQSGGHDDVLIAIAGCLTVAPYAPKPKTNETATAQPTVVSEAYGWMK